MKRAFAIEETGLGKEFLTIVHYMAYRCIKGTTSGLGQLNIIVLQQAADMKIKDKSCALGPDDPRNMNYALPHCCAYDLVSATCINRKLDKKFS